MQIVIIHPEQWNGGSDRCTMALIRHFSQAGHQVIWYTTMIDEYWKDEDFSGIDVRNLNLPCHPGDWWSQNAALGLYSIFDDINPDAIIIDHSASCLPILKWRFPRCKILFYCHFPQQLVTPSRFFLYRWYSGLIGLLESHLFELADVIMVNSKFTAENFHRVMPNIAKEKLTVVYPPCDVDAIAVEGKPISRLSRPKNERYIFLSMNRFWPEKRLDIIVGAAAIVKKQGYNPIIQIAGSVMPHIPESKIYYKNLLSMSEELDVNDIVQYICSPSESEKFSLYRQCDTALYTPPNEHFGIVPIEALDQRRPVIVCDSGGPSETVFEDITGTKIKEPSAELLAEAMMKHMSKDIWEHLDLDEKYQYQRQRIERDYSTKGYVKKIDDTLRQMISEGNTELVEIKTESSAEEKKFTSKGFIQQNLRQRG
uniref:Alpha-1,3/1,6-mannosyltransferase ALG2 n=1 Tax=Parastrongyloides trichosuri TaxID=131310 RepID=A0A0N4Z5U7_PARTI